MRKVEFDIFKMIAVKKQGDEKVQKNKNLAKTDDRVYDFETETHDFNCGFPSMVQKTESFVLSIKTEIFIKDLKNLEDMIDFGNLDENHEIFSNINKKVLGKSKVETAKNNWVGEFVCLRSEMYAFKCANDGKNKLK